MTSHTHLFSGSTVRVRYGEERCEHREDTGHKRGQQCEGPHHKVCHPDLHHHFPCWSTRRARRSTGETTDFVRGLLWQWFRVLRLCHGLSSLCSAIGQVKNFAGNLINAGKNLLSNISLGDRAASNRYHHGQRRSPGRGNMQARAVCWPACSQTPRPWHNRLWPVLGRRRCL